MNRGKLSVNRCEEAVNELGDRDILRVYLFLPCLNLDAGLVKLRS